MFTPSHSTYRVDIVRLRFDVGIDPYIPSELRSIQRTGWLREVAGGW